MLHLNIKSRDERICAFEEQIREYKQNNEVLWLIRILYLLVVYNIIDYLLLLTSLPFKNFNLSIHFRIYTAKLVNFNIKLLLLILH